MRCQNFKGFDWTISIPCVCVSVNSLTATYLVFKSKMQCHKVPFGDPNACIVCISPTPLSLPVLALFADSKLFDLTLHINKTLSVTPYTVSLNLRKCVVGQYKNR